MENIASKALNKPGLPGVTLCRYKEIYSHGRTGDKALQERTDVDGVRGRSEQPIHEPQSPPIKK
jgi:hypothetical protein